MDKMRELAEGLKEFPAMIKGLEGMLAEVQNVALKDLSPDQAAKLQKDVDKFELPDKIKEMHSNMVKFKKTVKGFD